MRAEPTSAAQTTHAVTLPSGDPRASGGLAFAIVTVAADGSHRHYALSIRSPRKDRYGASCSIAWYASNLRIDECAGHKAPPPLPLNTPPPRLVAAPRAPMLARSARRTGSKLRVHVRAAHDGSVRAMYGGRGSAWTAVRAGRWRAVRVPLRARRRLPRRVTVRVTLRTATGTVTVRRRLVVRGVR